MRGYDYIRMIVTLPDERQCICYVYGKYTPQTYWEPDDFYVAEGQDAIEIKWINGTELTEEEYQQPVYLQDDNMFIPLWEYASEETLENGTLNVFEEDYLT